MFARQYAATVRDRPALVMAASGARLTYAEYEANANRLAHLFRSLGLRRGDHVAMFMENNLRYFETMAAAERVGLYYTCINSFLTADEVAYIVDDCDAAVLITSAARLDVALDAASRTPKVTTYLAVDTTEPVGPFLPYEAQLAGFPSAPVEGEELGAAMLYSSGTTGRPKGIVRPLPSASPADELPAMTFARQLLGMREDMVYLSPAPIYHAAPQASVATALRLGATSIIMERFDAEQFLALVERHRVTHANLVPTMFVRLLKLPEAVRRRYDVSSLETVAHASAPCPADVKDAMIEWLGPIVVEYYGSTEANGYTYCDSEEWLAHRGTVGRPVFGTLRILDDSGREVGPGEVGEVWFEGGTSFEYYKDPAKTAAGRDASGSRSTVGDLGYVDADGYLHLTDRKHHVIISGGVNIYPQEIEDVLVTHPKVDDVAVFGIPNAEFGEEVKAVVQLAGGVVPDGDVVAELLAYGRSRLARFKCPKSIDFEAVLPRLPTGKLYKQELRDRYWIEVQRSE